MRKFNLKDHAAKRMMDLEKAGRSGEAEKKKKVPETPETRHAQTAEEYPGFRIIWSTDVGRVRKTNQDSVIIGNGLAGVADGMGGHNAGEIASGGLRDGLIRETEGRIPDRDTLEAAVKTVNARLFTMQEEDASLTGMGTTLTVLWPTETEMIIAQVGDSRAYLIRDGKMSQMTSDHSMVADMVRKGILTEEQAACHPMRNYITRAIGTDDVLDVDIYTEKREAGDRWLICSDGLYGMMTKAELAELASIEDPEEAAEQLMQTALENGGRDNVSLVLMMDDTGAKEEPTPEETLSEKTDTEETPSEETVSDEPAADETPDADEAAEEGADE